MDMKKWKSKIKRCMEQAGTYREHFAGAIDTLAKILEQRDTALAQFEEAGGEMVVEKVSDRGAVNITKNPRLQVLQDLNKQALEYWRDLGLTPAGLKRIDETAMKKKKTSALADALKAVDGA